MKQANVKFEQQEHDALARIFSAHNCSSALIIFRCEDGSQAHITILEKEAGKGREEGERIKNLVALDLLRVTTRVIEDGENKTLYYAESGDE